MGALDGPTSSYYALYNDISDPNHTNLSNEGTNEPPANQEGSFSVIFVGGPCSSTSIQTFGGPCVNDTTVAQAADWWIYGYAHNAAHNQSNVAQMVLATNNSTSADNGNDFLWTLVNTAGEYASVTNAWLAQNDQLDRVSVQGGNDLETNFNSPAISDPEVVDFGNASYSACQLGDGCYTMYDLGAMYNSCNAASCWDQPLDHGWSQHQIWMVNRGYPFTAASPEIYDTSWPAYYADLDQAADAARPTSCTDSHCSWAPNYIIVLYGCAVGDETNADTAYTDFNKAVVNQQDQSGAPYSTSVHAYGNHDGSSC